MIIFKVKESILKVGPRKGQKAYSAVPKAPNRFSSTWLVERIVRETSLSEGDVRNVLITLRNIVKEIVSLGGALDLGDIFSLRTVITSKMEANEKRCLCNIVETSTYSGNVERVGAQIFGRY